MSLDNLTITAASEIKGVAFNQSQTITFNANIKAPKLENQDHESRKPVDIVCVIDKSGSMSGQPIELVKETLSFMVQQLKDSDRLSVVTFGDDAQLVCSLSNMDAQGREKTLNDIKNIRADGWTHLSGGIMLGLDQLASRPSSSSSTVTSLLVFTDGQANRGITKIDELVQAVINRLDAIGGPVSVHTFGFSENHDPELLTRLSEAGNGVFYYLPSVEKIPEVFADCLGGLLSVVALSVKLEAVVELTGATIVQTHTAFPTKSTPTSVTVSVAQMYSEQNKDILFDVNLPSVDATDVDVKVLKLNLSYMNRAEQTVESSTFAVIDRVTPDSDALNQRNEAVVQQKARILTATAMKEALSHKAKGDITSAKNALSNAKKYVSSYADYSNQLTTAEEELDTTSGGYLWTNMRSHYAQSSVASGAPGQSGYANEVQMKMRSAAPKAAPQVQQASFAPQYAQQASFSPQAANIPNIQQPYGGSYNLS